MRYWLTEVLWPILFIVLYVAFLAYEGVFWSVLTARQRRLFDPALPAFLLGGIGDDGRSPLFRSAFGRTGLLNGDAMHRVDAYRMIQRRAAELGMRVKIGCHTFRATGITAYLEAGGTLENAQAMAAHESPRTTKLYDRTREDSHRTR